ncbi:hypothetical protein LCGC14_1287130 [marine sediment metagenome]|uniref:Uncharacterized protein n=1 Tax=marine sediment metagenome TaxID=412755 RepID=A0A0F9NWH4_9ZZZZ
MVNGSHKKSRSHKRVASTEKVSNISGTSNKTNQNRNIKRKVTHRLSNSQKYYVMSLEEGIKKKYKKFRRTNSQKDFVDYQMAIVQAKEFYSQKGLTRKDYQEIDDIQLETSVAHYYLNEKQTEILFDLEIAIVRRRDRYERSPSKTQFRKLERLIQHRDRFLANANNIEDEDEEVAMVQKLVADNSKVIKALYLEKEDKRKNKENERKRYNIENA